VSVIINMSKSAPATGVRGQGHTCQHIRGEIGLLQCFRSDLYCWLLVCAFGAPEKNWYQ